MHQAFKNPALAQAKNELTELSNISLAPEAAYDRFSRSLRIPNPMIILEVHAAE
jgi:hypothetical protein